MTSQRGCGVLGFASLPRLKDRAVTRLVHYGRLALASTVLGSIQRRRKEKGPGHRVTRFSVAAALKIRGWCGNGRLSPKRSRPPLPATPAEYLCTLCTGLLQVSGMGFLRIAIALLL